jgi:hypothetical protein
MSVLSGVGILARDVVANKKSLYVITTGGRLAELWDTNVWNLDFPAELAGQEGLRFEPFTPGAVESQRGNQLDASLYVVAFGGQLVHLFREGTGLWNLDFPAELAGQGGLRFLGSPAVFGRDLGANKKSIYAITNDGRLTQLWDTNVWNLDFPAELAGQGGLRFQGSPAVFGRDQEANETSVYAITNDGRLAQLWDTNVWNLDFPAELAGQGGLRFQGSPAVFERDPAANKKSIYAITNDGRLAQLWDTNVWNLDFPADLAGQGGLRFQGSPSVLGRDAAANKKSIYAITTTGQLTQVWDTDVWNLDFPPGV